MSVQPILSSDKQKINLSCFMMQNYLPNLSFSICGKLDRCENFSVFNLGTLKMEKSVGAHLLSCHSTITRDYTIRDTTTHYRIRTTIGKRVSEITFFTFQKVKYFVLQPHLVKL